MLKLNCRSIRACSEARNTLAYHGVLGSFLAVQGSSDAKQIVLKFANQSGSGCWVGVPPPDEVDETVNGCEVSRKLC